MTIHGLLVEDHNGQDFLLTTESCAEVNTHRLIVLQRINGRWQRLDGMQESACRESLIGAFIDFFVDICRILNSSASPGVPAIPVAPDRPRARPPAHAKPRNDK